VARVNSVFFEGQRSTQVAVLHPIVSLWAHFIPSQRSMYEPHPSQLVRFIDDSFTNLCRDLLQQQIAYDVVDERSVAAAGIGGGKLEVGKEKYDVLVLPPLDTIRISTLEKILRFVEQGGSVFGHPLLPKYAAEGSERDGDVKKLVEKIVERGGFGGSTADSAPLEYLVKSRVGPPCYLTPNSTCVLCTPVSRNGKLTYFLVNVSEKSYEGKCIFSSIGRPIASDPETGREYQIQYEQVDSTSSQVDVVLRPFASLFVEF
jgi:hypothetical protein